MFPSSLVSAFDPWHDHTTDDISIEPVAALTPRRRISRRYRSNWCIDRLPRSEGSGSFLTRRWSIQGSRSVSRAASARMITRRGGSGPLLRGIPVSSRHIPGGGMIVAASQRIRDANSLRRLHRH